MSSAIIRAGAVFDRPHLEDFMAKKRSGSKRAQSRGRKTSGRSGGRKGAAKRGARKSARKGAAKARKGAAKKGGSRKTAARKTARKAPRRSARPGMGAGAGRTEFGATTPMPEPMGDLGTMPADVGGMGGGKDEDEM